MKTLILAFCLVCSPALAQPIETWLADTLAAREDKSWVPSLRAGPQTVKKYPTIGGYNVTPDNKIPDRELVLFGSGVRAAPVEGSGLTPAKPAGPYTEEMARYSGLE